MGGVGVMDIFIYVFIHYNLRRWSRGVGVLGSIRLAPYLASVARPLTFWLLPPAPSVYRLANRFLQWIGR